MKYAAKAIEFSFIQTCSLINEERSEEIRNLLARVARGQFVSEVSGLDNVGNLPPKNPVVIVPEPVEVF